MKKRLESAVLNILGIIPLILGILAVLNSLYLKNPTQILWMCYISLIVMGIGILSRKSAVIMSQVYILAIPLLAWDVDFLYRLAAGASLWGISDYFFVNKAITLGKIISLQHLVTIPMSIYAVYLIGLKKKGAWKWSFAQIILVYFVISVFFPPESNINCVFEPCVNFSLGIPYSLSWFLVSFSMTALSVLVLNGFFFRKFKFKERFI